MKIKKQIISGKWTSDSLFIVNVLLTIFMGEIIFNLARGLNIHCGCFSKHLRGVRWSGQCLVTAFFCSRIVSVVQLLFGKP